MNIKIGYQFLKLEVQEGVLTNISDTNDVMEIAIIDEGTEEENLKEGVSENIYLERLDRCVFNGTGKSVYVRMNTGYKGVVNYLHADVDGSNLGLSDVYTKQQIDDLLRGKVNKTDRDYPFVNMVGDDSVINFKSKNAKAQYLSGYKGNTRKFVVGFTTGTDNNKFEFLGENGTHLNLSGFAYAKMNLPYLELGRDIRLGFGGGDATIAPEDNNMKKTLKLYSSRGENCYFDLDLGNKTSILNLKNPTNNTDAVNKQYVDTGLNGKVDKSGNKQLSDENFTTVLKSKLEALPEASQITQNLTGKVDNTVYNQKIADLERRIQALEATQAP